ncbi:tyrosine-type recombinase/integrase [Caulobacter sp. UNC279MFTsu5.1]|uniref:tyrosine-type recombinase/integrase n=1 Tax=Caulobacter sp. UNC279MFTsu5.1 TaxID=1502775 RepID=UPI00036D043C|nr:tyrosine-type recombinase/integrase [Caulobacter sp. UNC279MFTsu5.1]SFK42346.1 Phage integrase family protein [Caulobacter sp. UNC279MFTsu5.1]
MSRRSKGPRLHLRSGRIHARTGKPIPDIYYIRDGQVEISTGCGPDGLAGPDGAEAQLAAYILQKSAVRTQEEEVVDDRQRRGDPAKVLIAEVLALYLTEKAPKLADPKATNVRVQALMKFFGADTLADVRRSTCQAYVADRITQPLKQAKYGDALDKRVSDQGARRELEDLSAAIHYWNGEYPLSNRPKVWLPDKPESPRDALTRDQVAALLMAARGYRIEVDAAGKRSWRYLGGSVRANRAHLRRFVVMGVYSGSRPTVTMKLLWAESPVQAWIDLDAGMIWRRGKREKDHKTKRRPVVKITGRLLAHMRRWKKLDDMKAARLLEEENLEMANTVLHHGGAPIDSVRTGFEAIVADAGLAAEVTPHWLRHTCCTWLMEADCPAWEAAAFTGMTMKTLEDNYGHHRPSHNARARKALS